MKHICDYCGKEFERRGNKRYKKIYCNRKCKGLAQRKITSYFICSNCQVFFYRRCVHKSQQKGSKPYVLRFCTNDCRKTYFKKYPAMQGKKHSKMAIKKMSDIKKRMYTDIQNHPCTKYPDKETRIIVNQFFKLTFDDFKKHDVLLPLAKIKALQLELKREIKKCQ